MRAGCPLRRPLHFGVELRYLAVALPKLDIVSVYKLLCRFHRRFVVGAVEFHGVLKVAVPTDNIRAVVGHVMLPVWIRRERDTLSHRSVPMLDGDGADDASSGVGWPVKMAHMRKGINVSLTNYGRREIKGPMRARQNSGGKPDVFV
jgi:hypothetical protein